MTTLPTFDPWAELARIRAENTPLSPLSPTFASRDAEVKPLYNRDNGATFATFATFASPHRENGVSAPSPEWGADDWCETYEERLAVAMTDGEQPEPEARRIAWECCIVRWLDLHPVRSAPDHCVECGKADMPGNIVPFGTGHAWLHPECWERWHARRRAEAVAALFAIGIAPAVDPPSVGSE